MSAPIRRVGVSAVVREGRHATRWPRSQRGLGRDYSQSKAIFTAHGCPECGSGTMTEGRCRFCPICGWSQC